MAGIWWFGQFFPTKSALDAELKRRGKRPQQFYANNPKALQVLQGGAKQGNIRASGYSAGEAAADKGWKPGDPLTGGPIPNVHEYGTVMAEAEHAYQNAVAGIEAQRKGQLEGLGFTPEGQVSGLNQYGQYQLNRRSAGLEHDALMEQSTERGLGSGLGGLGAKDIADSRFQHGQGMSNILANARMADLQGQQGLQQAAYDRNRTMWQAQLDSARDAIADENFSVAPQAAYQQEWTAQQRASGGGAGRPGRPGGRRPGRGGGGGSNGPWAGPAPKHVMKLVNGRYVIDKANERRSQQYRRNLARQQARRRAQRGGAA